jgi:hypothetical protein
VADRARRAVRAVGQGVSSAANWVADGAISLYQGARRLAAGGVARALEPGNPTSDPNATTPTSQTTSTTPLQNQTYAHGAFMGAAVTMMNDSHWQQIFSTVMPEAYARARNLTEPEAVMAELENNPVLAAYGQSQHLAQSGASGPSADHPSVAMEWDVWLPQDPAQIGDLNRTRIAHGNVGTTIGQRVAGDQEFGRQRADVANAPGADQWMTYFGRAIALHRGGEAAQHDPQGQTDLEQATQLGDTSAATRIAASYLRAPSGLYLDVKSMYSTPEDINAFIAVLRNQGINVIGVGSFSANQLEGLDANVRPIQFFHGLADLMLTVQNAPDPSKAFHNGDSVMFNAGSLLTESRAYVVAGERSYTVDADAVAQLRTVQTQFGLRVGLYVQETSVDAKAVEQIVQLVNANPDLFSLGFAYGNVSGRAEGTVTGTGLGAQAPLEFIAKRRLRSEP